MDATSGRITFVNKDPMTHNLVGDTWSVDEIRSEQSHVQEFTEGIHAYSCTLHPGMVGAVVVGDLDDIRSELAAAQTTSSSPEGSGADRLPWGMAFGAIGAIVGILGTLGVRRRQTP